MTRQQTGPIRLAKLTPAAYEATVRTAARLSLAQGKRVTLQEALETAVTTLEARLIKEAAVAEG